MTSSRLSRREFLRRGTLAGVGLSLGPVAGAVGEDAGPPRIRRRVTLGRSGLEVPDIGFGSFLLRGDQQLVLHALDRGITHFDTAESYGDGESELTLGRALRGRRHQVTLTSKYVAAPDDTAARQMQVLEKSLRRLQTDYVDIYLNHAVNEVARLENPEWHAFVARAKQQGKIRSAGMSGHGSRLTECLDHALGLDFVDVILVAYNFSQVPSFKQRLQAYASGLAADFDLVAPQQRLPELLTRAHAQGVGVMAMKTLKGAQRNDMEPYRADGASFPQAAFRWVLSSPDVDALVISLKTPERVDDAVGGSGWRAPDADDLALLGNYEARNGRLQCQLGCGACAESCPQDVPISEVLRARMYALSYGAPEVAAREYAALGAGATACLSCADPTCLAACPSQLPIPDLTRDGHARLKRG